MGLSPAERTQRIDGGAGAGAACRSRRQARRDFLARHAPAARASPRSSSSRPRSPILDEPTSGLDPQATLEFLDLIGELKAEGVTVLLSSHLLDQVQRICDRVALFQSGRIVLMGSVAELLGPGAGRWLRGRGRGGGQPASRGGLSTIPGVSNVETLAEDRFRMTAERDVRPDAARAWSRSNGSLRRLSVDEPSLEAIYARYFQGRAIGRTRHAA